MSSGEKVIRKALSEKQVQNVKVINDLSKHVKHNQLINFIIFCLFLSFYVR